MTCKFSCLLLLPEIEITKYSFSITQDKQMKILYYLLKDADFKQTIYFVNLMIRFLAQFSTEPGVVRDNVISLNKTLDSIFSTILCSIKY